MMKTKHIKYIVITFILCVFIFYIGNKGGFVLSENKAIMYGFAKNNVEVVHQQEFNNRKIVIFKVDNELYSRMIVRRWGIFYQSVETVHFSLKDDPIGRAWSARKNLNDKFETFFAVQVRDTAIKKIVVNIDNLEEETETNIEQIRKNSTFFTELEVRDGYGSQYVEIDKDILGAFKIRGIDEKGNVVVHLD